MTAYYLRTLGTLSLQTDGPDGATVARDSRPLLLLALLAVTPGHRIRRDHLAELVWPHVEHPRARRSLRQSIYQLSRLADAELIRSTQDHLTMSDAIDCDMWDLDRAVQEADWAHAVDGFEGRFLHSMERKLGSELSEWIDIQNQRVRQVRRTAYESLIESGIDGGDTQQAVLYSRRYVALDPFDQRAQLSLIHSLVTARENEAAFQSYEEYRTLLKSALDEKPAQEVEISIAEVRKALTQDREWKPIAPTPIVRSARLGRGSLTLILGGALMGVAGMLFAFLAFRSDSRRPRNTGVHDIDATILVTLAEDPLVYHELRIDGSEFELRRSPLSARGYFGNGFSPDLSQAVTPGNTPRGVDLELLDTETGHTRVVLDSPADERGESWSPDQRQLIVNFTRLHPESGFQQWLGAVEIESGSVDTLLEWTTETGPAAAWSPDGAYVARVFGHDGEAQFDVAAVGGEVVKVFARQPWPRPKPVWSLDGNALAMVWEEDAVSQLAVWDVGSAEPRVVTRGVGTKGSPVWVSNGVLAYVQDLKDGGALLAVDVRTGETQQLTRGLNILSISHELPVRIRDASGSSARVPWIEQVRLDVPQRVVPGQRFGTNVVLTSASGQEIPGYRDRLKVFVLDTTVVRVEGDGSVVALAEGRTAAIASYGGWRADTVVIESRDLVLQPAQLLFVEDWTEGISDTDWLAVGTPSAYAATTGGPEGGGVLVANGDQNHISGLFTREGFDWSTGITLEVYGRMPFDGRFWQAWELSLGVPARDSAEFPESAALSADVKLVAEGPNGIFRLEGHGTGPTAPIHERPSEWHLLTLQIEPDGTGSAFVDGRLLLRQSVLLDPRETPDRLHLWVGGATVGIKVEHGLVRVYEGLRYRWPDAADGRLPLNVGGQVSLDGALASVFGAQ